jgi:hypothetical protein
MCIPKLAVTEAVYWPELAGPGIGSSLCFTGSVSTGLAPGLPRWDEDWSAREAHRQSCLHRGEPGWRRKIASVNFLAGQSGFHRDEPGGERGGAMHAHFTRGVTRMTTSSSISLDSVALTATTEYCMIPVIASVWPSAICTVD